MDVCAVPPSWMWAFSAIGAVFAMLTASTLVFRHRHLRFTAMVTLIFGCTIFFATIIGPVCMLLKIGDTSGIGDVAHATLRWGAFRHCFAEGGFGALIPLFFGAIGVMVARVARKRAEPPRSIPPALPPA